MISQLELEKLITRHYPNAQGGNRFFTHYINTIREKYGIETGKIMYAHSVCADDVNSIKYPPVLRSILGPFGLGGLDGFPFTGLTGMGAYAHHVPDGGAALIFYAPHIGISEQGELGKIRRHGQQHNSGACGAAILALQRLERNEIEADSLPEDDFQQAVLQKHAFTHKERILAAPDRLKELTEVMYEHISMKIQSFVRRSTFHCDYIFLIGGIIINTSEQFEDYVAVRSLQIYDGKTGQFLSYY